MAILSIPGICNADYKTQEFRDKSDRVSTMYKCAVIGHKYGFAKDAFSVLAPITDMMEIDANKSGLLLEDAYKWHDSEISKIDVEKYWLAMCDVPFNNMRRVASDNKTTKVLDDIAENATLEQIGSASCAINAMSDSEKKLLMDAMNEYYETKDSIRLIKKFENDFVPNKLSKCFQLNATETLKIKKTKRDFYHFYDGSERALRLLLSKDILRKQGYSSKDLKQYNDQIYEGLLKFNREYY